MGDYVNPCTGAMNIHDCALDSVSTNYLPMTSLMPSSLFKLLFLFQLKGTHIKAPLGKRMEFSTEHLDQYTPKPTEGKAAIDAGKLQRSSVPLGTLNEH